MAFISLRANGVSAILKIVMVQIPIAKFIDNIFPWQEKTLDAFDDWLMWGTGKKRFYLLKCHRRARKTSLLLNVLIRECIRNPNSVYPYVGPTYTEAKAIVWRDPNMLFSFLPPKKDVAWESNETELFVRFPNGSILPILGSDKPDALRGLDARGVGFDEWALQKKEAWYEIFRPIISQSSDRWAMFGYTPKGVTHATEMELRMEEEGWDDWFKIVIKASESHIIPDEELEKARREMPPWLYDQEYECADITDEELTLITTLLMESLKGVVRAEPVTKHIVSCDPDCSIDGDECVIYAFENSRIIDEDIMHERDTGKIAFRTDLMCQKHNIHNVIVDGIGIGRGVHDQLNTKTYLNVQRYDARERALEEQRFYNIRSESYWYVMEQMQEKRLDYPRDLMLRQDLSSIRVKPTSKRIQLEPKIDTKKRLGRSPDRGDCYVMGIYGQRYVEPTVDHRGLDYGREQEEPDLAGSYTIKSEL